MARAPRTAHILLRFFPLILFAQHVGVPADATLPASGIFARAAA